MQDRLAVAAKMAVRGDVAKSALMTYLGPNAGQRVLSGQIKRGDGETIRAAIVWGDLRNSTAMAEQLGPAGLYRQPQQLLRQRGRRRGRCRW